MSEVLKLTPETSSELLTIELDALSVGGTAESVEISQGIYYPSATFELKLAAPAVARAIGAKVDLHILVSADGVNFATPNDNNIAHSFLFDAAATEALDYTTVISLPAMHHKIVVANQTGSDLALEDNVLTVYYSGYRIPGNV